MIVLDENVVERQRHLLLKKRIRAGQIGVDVGHKGMLDTDLIPFLVRRPGVTFFTQDLDFYKRSLRHPKYCIVVVTGNEDMVAECVLRVLRHPRFSAARERMGRVVLAFHEGLRCWSLGEEREQRLLWIPKLR